jgi:hypothetical protein
MKLLKILFQHFINQFLRYAINIKQFEISLYLFYNENYNIKNFTQNLTNLNSLNLQDINNDLAQEFLLKYSEDLFKFE